jgi:hypothetical protein
VTHSRYDLTLPEAALRGVTDVLISASITHEHDHQRQAETPGELGGAVVRTR